MSVKYKRCATEDPDSTSVAIDFSSPFQFSSGTYNSYASEADYKSIFSYNHQRRNQNFEPYTGPPSLLTRICSILVTFLCYVLVFLTAPISLWFCIKVVKQNEKAVIFRLGRLQPIRGPGVMLVLPLVERWAIVDIKTRAFSVPPQQLLTTDGAVVEAGAEVYFRITDVLQCVANVQDLDHSNRTIAKTCLLNELSKRSRAEVEADKAALNTILQADISAMTTNWGVEIERVEMSPPRVLHAATGNSGPDLGALTSLIPGLNKSMVCPPDGANPIQQMHMAAMQKAGLPVGGGAGLGAVAPPVVPAAEAGASGSSGQAAVPMTIPNEIDPRRLISAVEKCVNESIIRSFDSLYRFEVDGPMGGVFYIDFKSAEFSCGEGEGPGGEADVTLSLSAQDMTLIFTGQLKAFQAYMAGRLRVSGDLNAAMRLEELMSKLTGKVQQ